MTFPPFSRRGILGAAALLGPLLRSGVAMPADPLLAAIRITEAADMAHRAAGLASSSHMVAGRLSAEWRAHREKLAQARYVARADLHALTPSTPAGARALVAYHAARAEHAGTTSAVRTARRRLREVFARSGAVQPGQPLPTVLAASQAPREADPVFAAILAAQKAERAFTASLRGLNEADPVAMRRADEAGDRSSDAINALGKVRPTTPAGFHALIRHYAADSDLNDPHSLGALALAHLASAIPPP